MPCLPDTACRACQTPFPLGLHTVQQFSVPSQHATCLGVSALGLSPCPSQYPWSPAGPNPTLRSSDTPFPLPKSRLMGKESSALPHPRPPCL